MLMAGGEASNEGQYTTDRKEGTNQVGGRELIVSGQAKAGEYYPSGYTKGSDRDQGFLGRDL